uniref:Putative secreted protein n=1 Tax=Ixodes ricinus TaxID=34613 RepID=A0A6B0U736_IXORI
MLGFSITIAPSSWFISFFFSGFSSSLSELLSPSFLPSLSPCLTGFFSLLLPRRYSLSFSARSKYWTHFDRMLSLARSVWASYLIAWRKYSTACSYRRSASA